MRRIRQLLIIVLSLMLILRSGMFVVRMVKEWNQPKSLWQPANENEQKIFQNYLGVGK